MARPAPSAPLAAGAPALRAQRPLAGLAWMLVSGLSFIAMTILVKVHGQGIPSVESAFLRFLFGLVLVAPAIPAMLSPLPPPRLGALIGLRGAIHSVGVTLWFFAITTIPMAEVSAINYLTPVCVTLGAALFLGERLSVPRLAAVAVAFLGVLVILRPGFRQVEPGHLAMIAAAGAFGTSYVVAKRISDQLPAVIVVAWMSLTVTAFLAPLAIARWVQPTPAQLLGHVAIAIAATFGHYAMTRAFRVAPASLTQPVTFLQMVWASIIGALFFAEPTDGFVILGALMIIAAVGYVALREMRAGRVPPAIPDTPA